MGKNRQKNKSTTPLDERTLEQIAGGIGTISELPHPNFASPLEAVDKQPLLPETLTPHLEDSFTRTNPLPADALTSTTSSTSDSLEQLFSSSTKTDSSQALADWLQPPLLQTAHPQETFINPSFLNAEKNIAQNLTKKNPKAMAQVIQERCQVLRKDVETWSNWERTTGSQKSQKLKMLDDIVSQLKSGATDPQNVWKQFERLSWIEQHSNKVTLAHVLAYQYGRSQAAAFGTEDNLNTLSPEHFGLKTVSKHFYENPAAQKTYQDGLGKIQDHLAEKVLKDIGGNFANPLIEVIEKNPQAAWNIMQLRTEALQKQLKQDGVVDDDSRIQNPVDGSPGTMQILSQKMPTDKIKSELGKRLKAIETIEQESGYSQLSDVAAAVAKGDIPLSQFKKPVDAESWTTWAQKLATSATDTAYSAVSYLSDLLKSSVTSFANSFLLQQAKGHTDAFDKKIDGLTQIPIKQRLRDLSQTQSKEKTRQKIDAGSIENLRTTLDQLGESELLGRIDQALKANTANESNAKSQRQVVNEIIKEHQKINKGKLSTDIKKAFNAYRKRTGVRGSIASNIEPKLIRSIILNGVKEAATGGELDGLLSLRGIAHTLQAFNQFADEVRKGPEAGMTLQEMEKAHQDNIKETSNNLADILIPPSYNPVTAIKRFLLKKALRDTYLNGISNYMTDDTKHDSRFRSIVNLLRSVKSVDITKGTDLEQAHRRLAFSKMIKTVVEQIANEPIEEGVSDSQRNIQAANVTHQIQELSNNVNFEKVLKIDPNSWVASVLSLGQGIGKSVLFYGPEKQKAKETILKNIQDISHLAPGFDSKALSDSIAQNNLGQAKKMVQTQIDKLGAEKDQKAYWEKLLTNINAYENLTTGLTELIKDTHTTTVENKLLPWLHGDDAN